MNKKKFNTKKMVELAIWIAVITLMAFTPLGYLKLFFVDIALIVIPVAVGAITLGPTAGAVLGFVFGLTSFILSFSSALGAMMLDINPLFRLITCIVPRVLCGWTTGIIYMGLKKSEKLSKISVPAANLACPLLNTVFFMTAFMLFYYKTPTIQNMAITLEAYNPFAFVVTFVGVNALIEAVACFIIGTAITKAVQVAFKQKM